MTRGAVLYARLFSQLLTFVAFVFAVAATSSLFGAELQPRFGAEITDLRSWMERRGDGTVEEGYPTKSGVIIVFVLHESVADKAALEVDDIIVKSGSTVINSLGDFMDWLESSKHGQQYTLTIWRRDDDRWAQKTITYRAAWTLRENPIEPKLKWDGPLMATLQQPIVYIADRKPNSQFGHGGATILYNLVRVQFDGKQPTASFFDVQGKPTKYEITSADTEVR